MLTEAQSWVCWWEGPAGLVLGRVRASMAAGPQVLVWDKGFCHEATGERMPRSGQVQRVHLGVTSVS